MTIKDVARHAGVSVATVSRALNRPSVVHPDTRVKVLQAIEELQYIPNSFARSLTTQRSGLIGLVVPEITNPFFSYVAQGCEEQLRNHQYGMVLCRTGLQGAGETGIYRLLRGRQVDGVILVSPPLSDRALPEFIQDTPVVYVDHDPSSASADVICIDNAGGGRLAAEHLIGQGHCHIAIVVGFPGTYAGAARLQGFREVVREHGLVLPTNYVEADGFNLTEGASAAERLMALDLHPTAIFASNDLLALGLLRGLQVLGWRVPDDVALVGFGDLPLCQFSTPSLTSVVVDKHELGRQAAELLVSRIESPSLAKRRVILPVHLAVRESSISRQVGRDF
ncbi:MAG: LacI family transcriptional regulator [Chloroflexi bacterium]|nr:LacI family transcriptional regulator [Chloroflexota bacterium]